MGDEKFEIPARAIETFGLWNTDPLKQQEAYDKLMIEALLLIFVTPEDMQKGNIADKVVKFIDDFLKIRTDDDAERMGKVYKHVEEARKGKKD